MTILHRFRAAAASLSGQQPSFAAWERAQFDDEVQAASVARQRSSAGPKPPPLPAPTEAAEEAVEPPPVTLPDPKLWAGLERVLESLQAGAGNFSLLPCDVNGAPVGLIVCYRLTRSGMEVAPLFVSMTPGMIVRGEDGELLYGQPQGG